MRPTDPPTAGSVPCYELNIEDDHNDMRWNEGRHVNMKNKWQQNSRFEYRRRREDEGKEKYVNRNKGMGMEANVINTNNEKDNGGNHKGKKDHEKLLLFLRRISNTRTMYERLETVFGNWEYITNGEDNNKGCIIMVGWNANKIQAWLISQSGQYILLLVKTIDKQSKFSCIVIYASNSGIERRNLWSDLEMQKIVTCGIPWVILGNYNVTLKVSKHSNGSVIPSSEMSEFQDCVNNIEVGDLHMRIPNGVQKRKSSFRFSNFITDKKEFLPTYGEVNERAEKLREKVKECQKEVDMFPHDERIKDKSRIILKECHKAIQDEYSLLCQKAKVEWLNEGLSKCGTAVHPEYHSIGHGKLPKVVYYIWQERNNRLFRNEKRDINTIINIAKEAVGMKLLGIKVKESGTVKEVEEKWM
ncbi:RNA-directed DNA polymerase, eukaryota, reverse transcriptase zinc-binding domain protein [Tanacetum coccineum]